MLIRIPEDKDIAQAINEMANGLEGDTIFLPPGRFNLMQEISFDTPRIAHDDDWMMDISENTISDES